MEFTASGDVNPIEEEEESAVVHICNNPLTIFECGITMPKSKGSGVIFLCHKLSGKVELN